MNTDCLTASSLRWHLVFTKPCSEQLAKVNLERQAYSVYFPRLVHKTRARGKWRDAITALFPRYLFVQLQSGLQSLAPIRSTTGVATVVRFGVEYICVPDRIINELKQREDSNGLHRLSLKNLLAAGSVVRIIEGALAGMEAVFETHNADERVTLLFTMLGRDTRVEVPATSIVPVR